MKIIFLFSLIFFLSSCSMNNGFHRNYIISEEIPNETIEKPPN